MNSACSNLTPRVGYVVKRYPRFSETFVVNEVLAHEAAGLNVEIFSLRPCTDTHFQDRICRVKAPWKQLDQTVPKPVYFLDMLRIKAKTFPAVWEASQDPFVDAVSLCQAIELATRVQQNGITHLHAHFATSSATVAMWAAKFAGITYSVTAHAKDIFHEQVNADELQQKLDAADAVITVSHFNYSYLSETYGVASKLHCVYNGMDLDELPFTNNVQSTRRLLGVGRFVKKKGFDDLIRACGLLRDRGIDFECDIVGGGDEEQALRDLIDEMSLHEQVRLVGLLPQVEVKQLVREAALFVAPCVISEDGDRDGLPTVLLESMAQGTACVATDVTGIPEIIEDQKTGLLAPQNNPAKLADVIAAVLDNPSLRQACANQARQLIETQFDSRETSAQIRRIFDSVAKRPLASAPELLEVS